MSIVCRQIQPKDISDGLLNLDFNDVDTLTLDGSYIDSVSDEFGGVITTEQLTPAARPIYVPNVKNGRGVARFDLDFLESSLNLNSYANMTIFGVYRSNVTASTIAVFGQDNGGYDRTLWANLEGTAQLGTGNGGIITISDFNTQDVWYIIAITYNGANSIVHIKNVLSANFAALSPDGGITTGIGAGRGGGQNPFKGDIGQLIFYGRALSDNERNAVINYLSNKFAI